MSSKSPFGRASHFANNGSWKAGSPTSNPLLLKAQSRQAFVGFAAVSLHNWEHNHCIVANLGDHNSVTKPSASLHETGLFLKLQRRDGHDASTMQNWWSVLSLSGTSSFRSGVDAWHFPKERQEWTPETNTSNHVEQVSSRQCITFREHWQLKGRQPRFQTTVAKSSI